MVARCLIISDRITSYDLLKQRVQRQDEPEVWLLEARDLRFFAPVIEPGHPEVVLLDIAASATKSLAATARVRALFPNAKVAVRAAAPWRNFCYLAIQAGAHGVIDASTYGNRRDLSMLIDSVLAGNLIYRTADSR